MDSFQFIVQLFWDILYNCMQKKSGKFTGLIIFESGEFKKLSGLRNPTQRREHCRQHFQIIYEKYPALYLATQARQQLAMAHMQYASITSSYNSTSSGRIAGSLSRCLEL